MHNHKNLINILFLVRQYFWFYVHFWLNMGEKMKLILFLLYFARKDAVIGDNTATISQYVFWPNATVPFYIVPEHFDREQSTSIMSTLALFAFKTCLKFVPALAPPTGSQHVLVIANPGGVKKCVVDNDGHPLDEPHTVIVGYNCLRSPQIDMMLMKALGFPFEHNRASRDLFIDVQFENIDPSAMELFTKEAAWPAELQPWAYDVDSVMHFGERDFSKNGHRTIIIKDFLRNPVKQNRVGLSPLDLRKIEVVYGPECRKRDRQEKIDICQNYPGVARRKREVDSEIINLRVNREITPPPNHDLEGANGSLKELGIQNEVQDIVDQIYKVSSKALTNARAKYCNGTKPDLRASEDLTPRNNSNPDILGIIGTIADYAKHVVNNAVANLTEFCKESEDIELYQRARCPFYNNGRPCPQTFRSTKSGPVKYSTQHRPVYIQSTKHRGNPYGPKQFDPLRSGNDTGDVDASVKNRRKRHLESRRDITKVNQRSKDEESTTVESQKTNDDIIKRNKRDDHPDDVTRVQRSRDEEATTIDNIRRNDEQEQSRKKRLVEVTATDKDQTDNTASSKGNIRMGTDIPLTKHLKYERSHRRIFKKTGRSKYENWDNSNVSFEKSEKSQHSAESDSASTVKPRDKSKRFERKEREESNYEELNRGKLTGEISQLSQESEPEKMDKTRNKGRYFETEERKGSDKRQLSRDKLTGEISQHSEESEPEKMVKTRNKGRHFEIKERKESDKRQQSRLHRIKHLENRQTEAEDEGPKEAIERHPQRGEGRSSRPRTVRLSKANEEFYSERKWPDGVVRYIFNPDAEYDLEDVRRRLGEVNSILKKKTCARLEEISQDETEQFEDYLVLDTGADYVTGRVGGKQNFGTLELFRGGQHRQHAAMVVMAMLGFYFELARHDRDDYVRVHLRHVRPDKLHHFEKIRADATFPLPYDYESATHPAWQFWRKLGISGISTVATFKTKDPDGSIMKSLGQNSKLLSDLDIVKINSVYGTTCFRNTRLRNAGKKRQEREPQQYE